MTEHRFEFTVSGVELTAAQKSQISEEIGVAVSRILAGMHGDGASSKTLATGPSWHIDGINGGRRWFGKDASAITRALVDAKVIQQPAIDAIARS
jgi:hypothetical protein